MHITVSLTTHSNSLTLNLAVTGQLYLPFPTKTTQLIGPVSDNVPLSASSNLTCINYSSPNYTGLSNSTPSFCSLWVLWSSTNNCTNPGIFIFCRTYAYSCLPLDSPGPCILVFLTPGLTFPKEEEVEPIVYPQGELSRRKRWAVIAPLVIGTGSSPRPRDCGHLDLGPFLLQAVPRT